MMVKRDPSFPILLLLLAIIFLIALGLRLWGIHFGLPYAYHVDEPTYVSAALNLGAGIIGRQPNPTGFSNVLFGEYALYFLFGRLTGFFSSSAAFEAAYRFDPSTFLLLGRLTGALLGTLTVLTVYWTGKAMRDRWTGLIAALFLATAFLHVRDSHFGVPDIAAAFLVSLTVLLCVLSVQRSSWRFLALAALSVGLAVTTKWSVWLVVTPFALTFFWSVFRNAEASRPAFKVGIVLVSLLVGLLLGGFQLFLQPFTYLEYALREWRSGAAGGFGIWQIGTVPGWIFYLKTLGYGLGLLLTGLALVGAGVRITKALRDRNRISLLLIVFPLLYFLVMGATRHYFARYALPLIPFAVLFASEAAVWIARWLSGRYGRLGLGVAAALVVATILQPVASSVRHDLLLTRTDTRTLAKVWIEQNIPAGAKIAVDWQTHGPPLATPELAVPLSNWVYDLTVVGGTGLADHPISWYRESGFEYLIASSFIYQIPLVFAEKDQERKAFYSALSRDLVEVQVFRATTDSSEPDFIFDEIYGPVIDLWQRERPGPTIKIYRIPS